jgi:glycyl-tRNA synthetase
MDEEIAFPIFSSKYWTDVRQFNLMFSTVMGSTAEGTATRQLIFWIREFEQLEMQFFVAPGTELEWFSFWKELKMKWHKALGFPEGNCRFHDHDKLAHHANAASDIECRYPFGFKEVEGNHSRTGFALASH